MRCFMIDNNINQDGNLLDSLSAEFGINLYSADEILITDFPETQWSVEGLIPIGFGIIGGRPKLGKSFFGLQISCSVANGSDFLGYQVNKGTVLYLALEDTPRRIKARLRKQNFPLSNSIHFVFDFPSFDDKGFEILEKLAKSKAFNLIIIDTATRFLGRSDQMEIGEMSDKFGMIQKLAQNNNITILCIDHFRKPTQSSEPDPIDDLLGSTGKSAPIDLVIGIYRRRGELEAKLMVIGRDIEDQTIFMILNNGTCTWDFYRNEDSVVPGSKRSLVLEAVKELTTMGIMATTSKIAKHLKEESSNVSRELRILLAQGKIVKGEKVGKAQPYLLAEQQPSLIQVSETNNNEIKQTVNSEGDKESNQNLKPVVIRAVYEEKKPVEPVVKIIAK